VYWRSPYWKSRGSSKIFAPRSRARAQCARTSGTRTSSDCGPQRLRGARLGNHHRASVQPELRTMISDLPANLEAELVAQPPDRLLDVLVDQHGDHRRRRHRPIEAIARRSGRDFGHKHNLYKSGRRTGPSVGKPPRTRCRTPPEWFTTVPQSRTRGTLSIHTDRLDTPASVGLQHTRRQPPPGPTRAFVLRRNSTAGSPRDVVCAGSAQGNASTPKGSSTRPVLAACR